MPNNVGGSQFDRDYMPRARRKKAKKIKKKTKTKPVKVQIPSGYTTDEFGELKKKLGTGFTMRPFTSRGMLLAAEKEILDAVDRRAIGDIQRQEDQEVFRALDSGNLTDAQRVLVEEFKAHLKQAITRFQIEAEVKLVQLLLLNRMTQQETVRDPATEWVNKNPRAVKRLAGEYVAISPNVTLIAHDKALRKLHKKVAQNPHWDLKDMSLFALPPKTTVRRKTKKKKRRSR